MSRVGYRLPTYLLNACFPLRLVRQINKYDQRSLYYSVNTSEGSFSEKLVKE